jgi:hypothetical protein
MFTRRTLAPPPTSCYVLQYVQEISEMRTNEQEKGCKRTSYYAIPVPPTGTVAMVFRCRSASVCYPAQLEPLSVEHAGSGGGASEDVHPTSVL